MLSNSWGGGGFSLALLDEINRANSSNMLFVAAAGNDSTSDDTVPLYPAAYNAPDLIAVAATDNNDQLASFSNYGKTTVHLGAPGVNILSTIPGATYQTLSGTSMATPHVSGAAMLLLSACSLNTADLKTALTGNVDLIPALADRTISGGRLNLAKALHGCSDAVAVLPGSIAFANQVVNTSSPPLSAVLTNRQSVALNMGGMNASGDFTVTATTCGAALSPSASCSISLSFLPSTLGSRSGTLTIVDDAANSPEQVALAGTAVPPPDQPPMAVLTVTPSSGAAPLVVNASTAGSSDPDGTIANSSIDFGDGTLVSGQVTVAANHTYSKPGTFTAIATVIDNRGASSKATQTVTVSPAAPVAVLTVTPLSGAGYAVVSATTAGSSSPDGTIVSSTINFGDGTPAVSGPTATHIYRTAGTFAVTGTVTDSLGATASATQTANVSQGCAISKTNRTVTICAPANNSTVNSPVTVVVQATDSSTVSYTQIYIDGTKAYQTTGSSVNTSLTLAVGAHRLTVQSADKSGSFKTTINITVGSSGSGGGGGGGSTPAVTILSPASGATVTSPVRVTASASDSKPVTYMQIYVDGARVYQLNKTAQLNTMVAMSKGSHRLTVQASDGTNVFKSTITITVH